MSTDVSSLIAQVNQLLQDGEPDNISEDEHSGYTGYKPQAVIDAMNAVFTVCGWGFDEMSSEIVTTGDKGSQLALAQVRVWLKEVEFKPVAWGQSRVTRGDIGDAKKGGQTDALKKALSYFSIGNRAYHGLLEKDKKPQPRVPPKPLPPAAPKPLSNGTPAEEQSAIPSVKELQKQCAAQFGLGHWQAMLQKALKVSDVTIRESDLTNEDKMKIKAYLDYAAKAKA